MVTEVWDLRFIAKRNRPHRKSKQRVSDVRGLRQEANSETCCRNLLRGGLFDEKSNSGILKKGEKTMASIKMVTEDEAIGKVKDIYEEIKSELRIDFVPNLYRVMASKPAYLEANWNKVKAVMIEPGELDRLTKEIIAVAVSAALGCEY
jgi:alkylhydroperoxidase/carboxymuconolactone decarboxylase family protein YurZ